MTRDQIRQQLIRDEGMRLKPYVDTTGHITIGVGRNLTDVGVTHGEALGMLDLDIDRASDALLVQCPWAVELDGARFGVLVNMMFNLGPSVFGQFKQTLRAVQEGRYQEAAQRMLQSKWAKQVGVRASRLSVQMATGEWQ